MVKWTEYVTKVKFLKNKSFHDLSFFNRFLFESKSTSTKTENKKIEEGNFTEIF